VRTVFRRVTKGKLADMAETEQTHRVDEHRTEEQPKDEVQAQQTPVSRMLANPRRVRRA
jgi:hypothetical protein